MRSSPREAVESLLHASAAIVWKTSADGEIVEPQPAWELYTGKRWEEYRGAGWLAAVHPDDRARVTKEWAGAVRSGGAVGRANGRVWSARDGSWRAFQLRAVPVSGPAGRIEGWLAALTDVQDAVDAGDRVAQRALERAEDAQRFLDDASRLLAASLDYDETLAAVTRLAVPRIADWAAVDLLDDGGALRCVAAAHAEPTKVELANDFRCRHVPTLDDPAGIGAVVRTGEPELVERVTDDMLVAALGDKPDLLALVRGIGIVSVMIVPLSLRGKVVGALTLVSAESRRRYGAADLAVAQELSRRATYAIENAMYVRDLAQATRKKDEFLAVLGHELRNPLAPIVTATSLIRARGRATAGELDVLERQAQHLVRLVDDLLDVSRVTSGKLSLQRRPLELAEVLAQAMESTAPRMEERRLRFTADVPATGVVVEGDRERLVQVVTNVLVNAAKFTPAGRAVSLTAAADGGEARITVHDEGEGIAADLLPHVFDLFTQGRQGVDRRSGGLGLGLAIARSIVLAHGGRIEAASPGPGRGTTITVRLPLLPSPRADVTPHDGPEKPPPASSKHRVLVVDDNADSAEMLARFLDHMGYDPFVANDARDALAISHKVVPAAAILDIGLPEVDGYELALALQEAFGERAPKLIALTGYAEDKDRQRALACGFAEHMAKPVDMSRLARTLRGLLVSAPCPPRP